jgi:hypothetical protein
VPIDLKVKADHFKLAVDHSFVEAKYRCAISLIIDDSVHRNLVDIFRYLKFLVENRGENGQFIVGFMRENVIETFPSINFLITI